MRVILQIRAEKTSLNKQIDFLIAYFHKYLFEYLENYEKCRNIAEIHTARSLTCKILKEKKKMDPSQIFAQGT